MAGKNDFRELKQYGTKELKFKQDVHIEAAYKGQVLSAPIYNSAKRGVCAALTMDWLKAKVSEGQYPALFNQRPNLSAAKNFLHQIVVSRAAPFQKVYDENTDGQKEYRRADLAEQFGLTLREFRDVPRDYLNGYFSRVADITLRSDQGLYCSCAITDHNNKEHRHAIGVVMPEDGIRFFDANVGAYKFDNPQKFIQFIDRWSWLYLDKLKYKIGYCEGSLVQDMPGVKPQDVPVG
jgi:Yersinia/Haemophilus virulence surface antigen